MDYFEIFGLARRLAVDEADLQRRFHELSRRHHPDFHLGASPEDQARALSTSALVNAAYRALRDPIRRIEYLRSPRRRDATRRRVKGSSAKATPWSARRDVRDPGGTPGSQGGRPRRGRTWRLCAGSATSWSARCRAEETRLRGVAFPGVGRRPARRAAPSVWPPARRLSPRAPICGPSSMISARSWGRNRSRMSRIIGIDLGTTNSLVAYVDEGTGLPRVIADASGDVLLPSVVSFTPGGILVGRAARRALVREPRSTIYSVKRFMGRGFDDVRDELRYFPFTVRAVDGVVRLVVGDREVTPPEVSAVILKSLRDRAAEHLGESIEKAVVTVPAYFNDSQRQATRDAGRIAGLDVVRIVNEPTAASLAYGLQRLRDGLIAVYDLGGGTFDISILRVKDGVFEVLATNGDTHLGGDDVDRAIQVMFLEDIRARHGVDLGADAEALQELRLAAEAAKIRLSTEERTVVTIPFDGFVYQRQMSRRRARDAHGAPGRANPPAVPGSPARCGAHGG